MAITIQASNVVGSEKDGFIDVVVTLSALATEQVSVEYATTNLSAGTGYPDYDYTNTSGKLVFAPGVLTQTIRVPVSDDKLAEGNEAFGIRLSNAVNAVIANATVVAAIVDNDVLADTVSPAYLSVRDVVVDASADSATFAIVLDKATSAPFTVSFSTADGNALAGSDYVATSGSLSFAAGETVKHVTVALPRGGAAEAAELFTLALGAVSGSAVGAVRVADGSAQAMIGGHGQTAVAAPSISVNNPVVGENDTWVDFVVSLSAPGLQQVSVEYAPRNLYAGLGYPAYDYGYNGGKLIFAPGVTTQTVRVQINNDGAAEAAETFALSLSQPVNAVIANPHGVATIVDNDTLADSAHRANLSVSDVTVDASADFATFTVTLDKAASGSFSVAYSTADGNAAAGSDYLASAGVLSFAPGDTAKTITIPLLQGTGAEPAELFNVVLGAVSGNAAGSVTVGDGVGQGVIGRHGQTAVATPIISVSNPVAGEKDGIVEFVVSLSAPALKQVSVSYANQNYTAGSGYPEYDYMGANGTLVFAPGETTQVVRVSINDDNLAEGIENLGLMLSEPVNAVIGNPRGVATVFDNDTLADSAHRAVLSVQDLVVDAGSDLATFTVWLDKALSSNVSVTYRTAGGTAAAGSDFLDTRGVLTFEAGETAKTVSVVLPHDGASEAAESFRLALGAVSGDGAGLVAIGQAAGSATIGAHGQSAVASPAVTISNPVVREGAGYAEFVISLSAPALSQVVVDYSTANGTAGAGYPLYDFLGANGRLVFAPGVTTHTVRVAINADTATEPNETFVMHIEARVGNNLIAKTSGTATVIDDSSWSQLAGSTALDTASLAGTRASYTVKAAADGYIVTESGAAGATYRLVDVERIKFSDASIALDIDGAAGQAYRIYQAAFDRTPDAGGLGYWIGVMDKGGSLEQVAAGFMQSQEFIGVYGANPGNRELVSKFYTNVLHRPADPAGLDYWLAALESKQVTAAQVLSLISESAENQEAVLKVIADGFPYTPYG